MTVLPDADGPFKLRVTDGKLKGSWLRTITVSKGEAPFEVTNWESIHRDRSQYVFNPQFVNEEKGACKFFFRSVAEMQKQILTEQGTKTKVVGRNWLIRSFSD
jgi:hypothetical protein